MHDKLSEYLTPTYYINSDHPSIKQFVADTLNNESDQVQQAIALYYAVRDQFRYDPYSFSMEKSAFQASFILSKGHGWCVTKAVLLAACCRCAGIPARLGFADVANHLSTKRMRETMNTDVFYWHGYTSIYLGGQWLKATPAFNVELCQKFNLKPLEFDGTQDSIYHEFDQLGNKHMEYLNDRGEYTDLPLADITATFKQYYPAMSDAIKGADFDQEVNAEVS
jgi:transglutaminase-like putative cysteine protease